MPWSTGAPCDLRNSVVRESGLMIQIALAGLVELLQLRLVGRDLQDVGPQLLQLLEPGLPFLHGTVRAACRSTRCVAATSGAIACVIRIEMTMIFSLNFWSQASA